jgi:hypothetical protein
LDRNILRLSLAPVAIFTGSLFLASNASAAVVGTLDTATTGTVTVSLFSALFNNDPSAMPSGDSHVDNATSLSFAGCSGVLGSAGCLAVGEGVQVNNADLTLAPPLPANANTFLTFATTPNLIYSITWPPTGSPNTDCATTNSIIAPACSVFAGSPIILAYASGNFSSAVLSVSGFATDTGVANGTGSAYSGQFSEPLDINLPACPTGLSPAGCGMSASPTNIQLFFCGTNSNPTEGTCATYESNFLSANPGVSASYFEISTPQSGDFIAAASGVPEPNTIALMLIGGALIGLTRVRRTRA